MGRQKETEDKVCRCDPSEHNIIGGPRAPSAHSGSNRFRKFLWALAVWQSDGRFCISPSPSVPCVVLGLHDGRKCSVLCIKVVNNDHILRKSLCSNMRRQHIYLLVPATLHPPPETSTLSCIRSPAHENGRVRSMLLKWNECLLSHLSQVWRGT